MARRSVPWRGEPLRALPLARHASVHDEALQLLADDKIKLTVGVAPFLFPETRLDEETTRRLAMRTAASWIAGSAGSVMMNTPVLPLA